MPGMHSRSDRRPRSAGRNPFVIATIVVVIAALVGGAIALVAHPRTAPHTTPTTPHRRRHAQPATFLGPWGVEARWVIQENDKPGTTAWRIGLQPANTFIEGYSNRPQARLGQMVDLYVSTNAPTFTVEAFRMGWYHGTGARLVWHSGVLAGHVEPACPVSAPLYMVQCSWQRATQFAITPAFVQGDYLLKLVASNGAASYVPLTVWDPSSKAAYVVMNAVFTWQVFNPFGGYDLYQQGASTAPGYPPPDRSRVVSFDRPYGYGNGAATFITNELPLIELMERHGLDVTYWTDITLATHGALLTNHRVLLSLGHDEEWSLRMREAVLQAEGRGVNLVFFGASPILRKVRLAASPLGPNLEVVNYRDPQEDPLYGVDNARVTQNWWGQAPADAPASEIVGDSYIGFNNTQHFPLVVTDASSWLYAGTGLTNGATVPNVLFTDFDGYIPARPNPPGVEILAHSPVVIGFSGAHYYADTTYVTSPTSKAGVFESGTNNWIPALAPCGADTSGCPAPILTTMTRNILRLFGEGPTGLVAPSTANWQRFYAPGSLGAEG
ncbi:conserved hypothetical protein [Acidimicrobium ferrooxidans DSM 10331]|uniref:N,N-dimethylformamidase beta subunit-like C-terminal domain-containing protein n=1 Tax=Acidimicrobium ferrooxidans (strain DSM 10331 / JCM 15462 / NBRC 103882 / ICP) TaxID=525909 RepID=C7LXV2_ACIFD|nr:N,N-dimethylformamidase beta subunit family domain-containing protein [Acidimicrobium ferrooxidans]ACU53560.1 conserved hypothetical protein [Acidimicrobium ferrooxidans DSM 10331]